MRFRHALLFMAISATTCSVLAQGFSSGSTGSDGALVVTSNIVLNMPDDGVFNFTTVDIAASGTLTFNPNGRNTPVYMLATGDIHVAGNIDVSGKIGAPGLRGEGGPGGFAGGMPAVDPSPPGAGQGPGAGLGGMFEGGGGGDAVTLAGRAAYGTRPASPHAKDGAVYGSPLLIPLLGGSGGGGTTGVAGVVTPLGGGGGGGAILLASSTEVDIVAPGGIYALGGQLYADSVQGGSGGAIRIVAPVVAGDGTLDVDGGGYYHRGGVGRIRIDAIDRQALAVHIEPCCNVPPSIGSAMFVFPIVQPRLDIVHVAGEDIAEGASQSVTIVLPQGAPATQPVTVRAHDFQGLVAVAIVITPDSGDPVTYPAQIDMDGGNPSQVTVNVQIPANTVTHVRAWTAE
jgi:hypothetical protein